jgi:capsular exopolysaccharide synthesis family protein
MTESLDTYEERSPESDRPEIDPVEIWQTLVRRRRLIALGAAVGLVLALTISLLTKPQYEASVILNIEPNRGSLLDVSAMEQPSFPDPDFQPTQMRLMRSREIAERVVRKLNLAADRDFNPPEKLGNGKPSAAAEPPIGMLTGRVRGNIETAPIRGTSLVDLTYTAPTPQLAADIANAVAEIYVEWTLEAKFAIVNQASQFLGAQVEQLKAELDGKEKELLAYGREKDIVSVDPRQNVTLQKLETLNSGYAAAVAERVAREAKDYEAKNASPEALANAASAGLVNQLKTELGKLERDYAEKLNLFKPEWPAMQQLSIQIEKARQHLDAVIADSAAKAREAARTDYMTALRREESLRNVLQSQKTEAMALNTNAVEYNNLRIEVETKRTLLDSLLKKQAETEVMSRLRGERISNIRIVDRALVPGSRSLPSYRKNLMIGGALGLLAGVGLSLLLFFLDRSLYSTDQVEQFVRVPALGVIPSVGNALSRAPEANRLAAFSRRRRSAAPDSDDDEIQLVPHRNPQSGVAEAYRAFRTALLLSRAGGVRSIVVTSCLPAEGKTATSANLATVLGQLGKRVLLVDADLHRPRLHKIFRVSDRVGLVSVLAEDVEPSQAIIKTSVPGVFVVAAGPPSPNPSGLLASTRMSKFLELAQMNFDYVVVDTPPLFPVADVLVFAQQCDGVVLCVRAGKTARERVTRARDRILRAQASVLGVLLNGLDPAASRGEYRSGYAFSYYGYPDRKEQAADSTPAAPAKVAAKS